MIKINLLQERREKRKGQLKGDYIVLILSIILVLGVLGMFHWMLGKKIDDTSAEIRTAKKDIEYYKSLTVAVNENKEQKKLLEERLGVINEKIKEKSTPAKILDELSIAKPERMHLESIKKEGTKLGIEGIALDDETIVTFMNNLQKSKLFRDVNLTVSEQVEQNKIKMKKFILSCGIITL